MMFYVIDEEVEIWSLWV